MFFYQANGKKAETVTFSSDSYKVYKDGNEISVLCGGTLVYGYSSKGTLLSEFSLKDRVLDLKIKNGVYYALSDRAVEVYEDGFCVKSCAVQPSVKDFFILPDQSVLVCYITETDRIVP